MPDHSPITPEDAPKLSADHLGDDGPRATAIRPRVGPHDALAHTPDAKKHQLQRTATAETQLPEVPQDIFNTPRTDASEIAPLRQITLSGLEKGALAICAAAIIGGLLWFTTTIIRSRPEPRTPHASVRPELPMQGSLFTVSSATTLWRDATPSDKVVATRVAFPTVQDVSPTIIPELKLTLATQGSTGGYIRIIFRNSEGTSIGDSLFLKLENGAVVPNGGNEKIHSPLEVSVNCPYGFLDYNSFLHYQAAANASRWTVELSESANASAPDSEWKPLGHFMIATTY